MVDAHSVSVTPDRANARRNELREHRIGHLKRRKGELGRVDESSAQRNWNSAPATMVRVAKNECTGRWVR
jgi:hypothetical protein